MDFDEMGIFEILEIAEDLGWEGCFDLVCIEGIDLDQLQTQAIEYIKTAQSLKDMVVTPKTLEEILNDNDFVG
jgi:hypothetical protein